MVQGIGPVNNLRHLVSVLREVSFDEVRDEALRVPKLAVVAPSLAEANRLAGDLFGSTDGVSAFDFSTPMTDPGRFDAVVVFDPEGRAEASGLNGRLRSEGAAPVFRLTGTGADRAARLDALRSEIAKGMPERATAFGRAYPPMRAAAAKAVIDETAIANAQFALISNLPAVVPIIGGLAAAGADFIVLTKNQVMMIYKLAAIYGRDLDDRLALLQEIVPVVGVGFAWRSLAREAASFLPFAAGTVPKVGIAFAGTFAIGRAAEFYYRTNMRPSRDQLEGYARQAQAAVARLSQALASRRAGNGNGRSPDADRA